MDGTGCGYSCRSHPTGRNCLVAPTAALTVYNCIYIPPASKRSLLDGDTFRCQGSVEPVIPDAQTWIPKVRLIKVNAPETGSLGADEARTALINWLMRR